MSIHWKGKGKGKKMIGGDTTMAGVLACLYNVWISFIEGESVRQVHPWQMLMTSEEVPLLGALKFFATLSCILQQIMSKWSQLSVCVCLSVCSFFQQPCGKGKCYICTSDSLQREFIKVTGEPQFSLAYIRFRLRDTITAHLWKLCITLLWKETDCYRKRNTEMEHNILWCM